MARAGPERGVPAPPHGLPRGLQTFTRPGVRGAQDAPEPQKSTGASPFSVPSWNVNPTQKGLWVRRWVNHFRKVFPSTNPKTMVGVGEGMPGRGPHRGQALHEPSGPPLSLGGRAPCNPSTLTSLMDSGAARTCGPPRGSDRPPNTALEHRLPLLSVCSPPLNKHPGAGQEESHPPLPCIPNWSGEPSHSEREPPEGRERRGDRPSVNTLRHHSTTLPKSYLFQRVSFPFRGCQDSPEVSF